MNRSEFFKWQENPEYEPHDCKGRTPENPDFDIESDRDFFYKVIKPELKKMGDKTTFKQWRDQ
jgi:hypothetical protein